MICLTNVAFGTESNTILDYCTLWATPKKAKLKYEKELLQEELKYANRLFENDPTASNRLRSDEIKEKLELLYEEKVKESSYGQEHVGMSMVKGVLNTF